MTIEPISSCTVQDQSGNNGDSFSPQPEDPVFRRLSRRLEQELLEIGGTLVVLVDRQRQLERLLREGHRFTGPVQVHKGKSDCRFNVAELWATDPDHVLIATGYALDQAGVWQQHCWALKDNVLHETMEQRQGYFGVAFGEPEAFTFWGLHYFSLYMYDDEKADQVMEQFPAVWRMVKRRAGSS